MRSLTAFSTLLLGVPVAAFLVAVWLTDGAPFASPANLELPELPAVVGGLGLDRPHGGAPVDAAELDWLKENAMAGVREAQMLLGHFEGEVPDNLADPEKP